MKFGPVWLNLILPAAVFVSHSDAASFMAPRRASLIGQTVTHEKKDMPVTKHNKTAGDDYNPGSPLYEKQEKLKKAGGGKPVTSAKISSGGDNTLVGGLPSEVPPQDKVLDNKYWWNSRGGSQGHLEKGIVFFLQYFIFVLLIALVWIKCLGGRARTGVEERKNTGVSFGYGLFSMEHCLGGGGHHSKVCLCSWCCAPIRLADTYAKEPFALVNGFWSALILVTCLFGLSQLTFGVTQLIFFCLALHFRQKLRLQYGLESGGMTWMEDFCTWFWCPCCAVAQEARQVEFVKKLGDSGGLK